MALSEVPIPAHWRGNAIAGFPLGVGRNHSIQPAGHNGMGTDLLLFAAISLQPSVHRAALAGLIANCQLLVASLKRN